MRLTRCAGLQSERRRVSTPRGASRPSSSCRCRASRRQGRLLAAGRQIFPGTWIRHRRALREAHLSLCPKGPARRRAEDPPGEYSQPADAAGLDRLGMQADGMSGVISPCVSGGDGSPCGRARKPEQFRPVVVDHQEMLSFVRSVPSWRIVRSDRRRARIQGPACTAVRCRMTMYDMARPLSHAAGRLASRTSSRVWSGSRTVAEEEHALRGVGRGLRPGGLGGRVRRSVRISSTAARPSQRTRASAPDARPEAARELPVFWSVLIDFMRCAGETAGRAPGPARRAGASWLRRKASRGKLKARRGRRRRAGWARRCRACPRARGERLKDPERLLGGVRRATRAAQRAPRQARDGHAPRRASKSAACCSRSGRLFVPYLLPE